MFCDMEQVSAFNSNYGEQLTGAVASVLIPKQPKAKIELEITLPLSTGTSTPARSHGRGAEDSKKVPPSPPPTKVEVNIETNTAVGGKIESVNVELKHGLADNNQENAKLPQVLINVAENNSSTIKLTVMVSYNDSSNALVHAGNIILEANETTTIMEVKKAFTQSLDICYEDMALICGGKFLSDSRSFAYYLIEDGDIIHLFLDTPNEMFKDVFEAFKKLGHSEELSWVAARNFIHEIQIKYGVEYGQDDNPNLTAELLMQEFQNFQVPDHYESDVSDSSSDEDSIDAYEYPPTVFYLAELDMLLINEAAQNQIYAEDSDDEDIDVNLQDDETEDSNSEDDTFENDEESSSEEDSDTEQN